MQFPKFSFGVIFLQSMDNSCHYITYYCLCNPAINRFIIPEELKRKPDLII